MRQTTEGGNANATFLRSMSIAKQAAKMAVIPTGMKMHDRRTALDDEVAVFQHLISKYHMKVRRLHRGSSLRSGASPV